MNIEDLKTCIELDSLKRVPFYNCNNLFKNPKQYLKAVLRSTLSDEYKTLYSKVVVDSEQSTISKYSLHTLLVGLNINNKEWKDIVGIELRKRLANQNISLDEKAVIAVFGKISVSKTEFKQKAEEVGLQVTSRYSDKVTHIVLGNTPKEILKIEEKTFKAQIISESVVSDYINQVAPSYLVAESDLSDNLKSLLQSDEESTVLLAIEMMKTGGVPSNIIPELFYVQKTTSNASIRKELKKTLLAYAPANMQMAVKDRTGMINPHKYKEYEMASKMKKIHKSWGDEVAFDFCIELFKRHKQGLRFVINNAKKHSIQWNRAIDCVYNDGFLNWTKALGYKEYESYDDEDSYGGMNNFHLPVEVLKDRKVYSLKLHNTKLYNLRREIADFQDLVELDLSLNTLKKLPKAIQKLKKLEVLNIRANRFESFPEEIFALKNLKRLVISPSVKIPDTFEAQLPNCQISNQE